MYDDSRSWHHVIFVRVLDRISAPVKLRKEESADILISGRPQSTMATAQVLFHRFYYVSSMLSFGVNVSHSRYPTHTPMERTNGIIGGILMWLDRTLRYLHCISRPNLMKRQFVYGI